MASSSPSEPQRSTVTVWRTGKSRRYSVRAVEGVTREQLDALVDLALAAERRIAGRPKDGEGAE